MKNKMSVYFRNKLGDLHPHMNEFTVVKWPNFKKWIKLHNIKSRGSMIKLKHKPSKSVAEVPRIEEL